jgi:hypothetical protein
MLWEQKQYALIRRDPVLEPVMSGGRAGLGGQEFLC